ncbi:hypothetical protein M409DRAFT_51276 [Zasmidium cellare ATCC 36951]|uniref:Transcription factor domain-containing protein n=1 Tax=Zasmidium cellare ATCC 36951 TaxID=1080233 RepID=A0A6A6CZ09_ZASCE|nr:uncharacterized protein M409DRAFT_51276 [Zasmidium cellare ATCC 36951]KAF2171049.1 hypothetical protein M409DRAFT_51276 [Zasmidium cellare ATCC 36951]
MSGGSYVPMQDTMQQMLQPWSTVVPDHYANPNAYWGPSHTLAAFSQPCFPEGIFDHSTTFSIDQHYQNIPFPANQDFDNTEGLSKPKKARAIQWMSTHASGLSVLAEKIDKFEFLLQKAEHLHSRTEAPLHPKQSSREHETQGSCQGSHETHARSAWLPVTQWPKAEDCAPLRLRPNEPVQNSIKEDAVHPEEDLKHLQYISAPLQPNSAMAVDLDITKIGSIFNSFLDHLDIFHSFLDQEYMRAVFHRFIERHGRSRNYPGYSISSYRPDEGRPLKRRRTHIGSSECEQASIERSPTSAMILLALAIGEITTQREPLSSTSEPLAPFTYSQEHESLRLIPGIGYFAAAMSIIGDYMDGNELIHAQIFLLAGLYKAQLARTREASSWYSMSGRVLTHLISRRHLFDENESVTSTQGIEQKTFHAIQPYRSSQDDLILRAAWACLQLEDELLPELRLPQSRLERLREIILLPIPAARGSCTKQNKLPGAETDEYRRLIYTAQLQLWRKFDRIKAFLRSDAVHMLGEDVPQLFEHHAESLQRWRSQLPPAVQWDDQGQPSNDVLHAQLRHFYWKAKTTILLPFLYYTFHNDKTVGRNEGTGSDKIHRGDTDTKWHILGAVGNLARTSGDEEVLRLAELCIEAIKQSLAAYTGISTRLVVSNIQSDAHGQFESLILLVAASQSERLSQLVPTEDLQQTLEDVLCFLRELSPISPTAAADRNVLEGLGKALGLLR